jgi:hypothetical protein
LVLVSAPSFDNNLFIANGKKRFWWGLQIGGGLAFGRRTSRFLTGQYRGFCAWFGFIKYYRQ